MKRPYLLRRAHDFRPAALSPVLMAPTSADTSRAAWRVPAGGRTIRRFQIKEVRPQPMDSSKPSSQPRNRNERGEVVIGFIVDERASEHARSQSWGNYAMSGRTYRASR